MDYLAQRCDVVIVGGGHAGAEAALACARLGMETVLFTLSLDFIANLPCNPSIGGTAKGHLVRELDALGGEMGKVTDKVFLQSRMLNRGKGPAVHSLRAQVDRTAYHMEMKGRLEAQPNLQLCQAEVVNIALDENGAVSGVATAFGGFYPCKAAIICTGTFLKGQIYVGDYSAPGGPDGLCAPTRLTGVLQGLGLPLRRFKTGTPARVHRDSIDLQKLEVQPGDNPVTPFSFETREELQNRVDCHIAYTNEKTHAIIRKNIHRSPLYSGKIEGTGPRYCPSIEDKVVRFPDKQRHQIFVEPVGLHTKELYIQGMSSSLPEDVQWELYRSVEGFENAQFMRCAYAIEYDCIDPLSLSPTLAFKNIPGLYGAGQFNGTSGYEEAAVQGFVAGVNAARWVKGQQPLVMERSNSYIGTLIDDLVTKGCRDPYRMMTSRSEFRLLLRQDNADTRLTPLGRELGFISDERWDMFHVKQLEKEKEKARINTVLLPPSPRLNGLLQSLGTSPVSQPIHMGELLRRPQISYKDLVLLDPNRPDLDLDVIESMEIEIKYDGYIKKQLKQVEQMGKDDGIRLPETVNYWKITGLRLEAREKLEKVRPKSIGQAMRISGVSPADISVLLIWLKANRGLEGKADG